MERKLEFAILSVLMHYNGRYEETLLDWYLALRLGLPRLTDPRQVRKIFTRLSAEGIIELSPSGAAATGAAGASAELFFGGEPFQAILTPAGLVRWNAIRVQPIQAVAVQAH